MTGKSVEALTQPMSPEQRTRRLNELDELHTALRKLHTAFEQLYATVPPVAQDKQPEKAYKPTIELHLPPEPQSIRQVPLSPQEAAYVLSPLCAWCQNQSDSFNQSDSSKDTAEDKPKTNHFDIMERYFGSLAEALGSPTSNIQPLIMEDIPPKKIPTDYILLRIPPTKNKDEEISGMTLLFGRRFVVMAKDVGSGTEEWDVTGTNFYAPLSDALEKIVQERTSQAPS